MRLINRLQEYLVYKRISPYAFERACSLSNGYLGKQLKGKGSVGSDILLCIKENYIDLSLVWLITGKGSMLLAAPDTNHGRNNEFLNEQQVSFSKEEDVIQLLKQQIIWLEKIIRDKDRIITLQEAQFMEARKVIVRKIN